MQGKGKKILWKVIFLSLDDMKNMMEKNIKENTKENIVIFSLLLSLKISEENKREGRDGGIKLALSSSPSLQFT